MMSVSSRNSDRLPSLSRDEPVLLSAILESAMDAIVVVDGAQQIVRFNTAAERMFGYRRDAVLDQSLDLLLPERYRSVHQHHLAAFIATGSTARAMGHLRPLAARRSDGAEFPIEATISQVEIDGRPYAMAIVRDISARYEADLALHRQLRLLNLAYDAIFTRSPDGRITFWNRGAEALYGYSAAEAVGRLSSELLKAGPEDQVQECDRALEISGTWEGELLHAQRDGTVIAVESRLVAVNEPNDRYVLEVHRDVTARKQAEREHLEVIDREARAHASTIAMTEQRDRLQEILDRLPAGVVIAEGPDTRIEFTNAAFVELVSGSGMPPQGHDFVLTRADGMPLGSNGHPLRRALAGERLHNVQLALKRADGITIPISVHAAPIRAGNAGKPRAIGIFQDTTQLQQAEQLKDDFLALVSHELRTPLTAIHGGARLLATQKTTLAPEDREEILGDVVSESERLDQLLSNLTTLALLLGGRLEPMTEPVLISSIVRTTIASIANRHRAHTFVVDLPSGLPPMEADPALTEQLLRNLYENAAKYSPDGGNISTRVDVSGETVTISITDEGIGIAPEHLSQIFERFRRVGETSRIRGMGLGLYLSRLLAEAQAGELTASSAGAGQGSTFSITLPILAE